MALEVGVEPIADGPLELGRLLGKLLVEAAPQLLDRGGDPVRERERCLCGAFAQLGAEL